MVLGFQNDSKSRVELLRGHSLVEGGDPMPSPDVGLLALRSTMMGRWRLP